MRRGQNTIVAGRASDATVLLSQYLTKVGNPKVAWREMWRVDEQRLAVRVATEKRHSREERRIGASQRRQARAGRFGADTSSARQAARIASSTTPAASISR